MDSEPKIPSAIRSFEWLDRALTWLFLVGFKMPMCKAEQADNTLEVIKCAQGLKFDGAEEKELTALLEVADDAQKQAIAHTEYEDATAARLLGPVAFLTTLGSVLLLKGVDIAEPGCQKLVAIVIASAFVFLVVIGTLMVLLSMVPRFNLPKSGGEQKRKTEDEPESEEESQSQKIDRTFFAHIAESTPEAWLARWSNTNEVDLKKEEIRSRIVGAYLISGKVALKIALLRRGVFWIISGLALLLVGIGNFAYISCKETKMLIAIDADNTLWDTNAVYENAQNGLIKRFCDVAKLPVPADALSRLRVHDQRIAKEHMEGYRYPIAILLEELRKDWAGNRAIEDWEERQRAIASAYQEDLKSPPKPFSSLTTTLEKLRAQGKLLLVTEGHEDKIRAQLKLLGIDRSFDGIEFVVKSPRTFLTLLKYADGMPAVMIGDQLDRDIEFARAAGWQTVWIPGGFHPNHDDREARLELPDVVVQDLSEAPGAVDRLKKKPPEKAGQ